MKEILKTLTEAMMLPEDSYSQQDDEFLEKRFYAPFALPSLVKP